MARKKERLVLEGDRVCPVCLKSPILDLRHGVSYCPAEGPHPGGVLVFGDRVVRADRYLHTQS